MRSRDDFPKHPIEATVRLLDRLILDTAELLTVLAPDPGTANNDALGRAPEAKRQVVELLGRALWDVFSQNHTVIDGNGTAYDSGSFRMCAGMIAERIGRRYAELGAGHGYLDFYMGTMHAKQAGDGAVYRWIFARLKDARCDWRYSFPRLYLVDLGRGSPADDDFGQDPSEAVRAGLDEAERIAELDALAESFDRAYEEEVSRARHAPLPIIVAAYRDVFGRLPDGWPHPDL